MDNKIKVKGDYLYKINSKLLMKELMLIISLMYIIPNLGHAQTESQILTYASRIKVFSLRDAAIEKGASGVTITNKTGQILRLKVSEKGDLGMFYGHKTFVLYEFKNNYIQRITFFDQSGKKTNHTGEGFTHAVTEFTILNPSLLKKKFDQIRQQDGNLRTQDEKEKIVLEKLYDTKGKLIHSQYLASDEYWNYQNMMYWD